MHEIDGKRFTFTDMAKEFTDHLKRCIENAAVESDCTFQGGILAPAAGIRIYDATVKCTLIGS